MKIIANEVLNLPACKDKYIFHSPSFFEIKKSANTAISFSKVKTKKLVSFDVPIYTAEHMKEAMALHLIDFIRFSQDHEFKNAVLNNSLNGFELDRLLNFVFQAEFHIPRLLSTTDYKKVVLRPMKLEEAIKTSNIYELSNMTKI